MDRALWLVASALACAIFATRILPPSPMPAEARSAHSDVVAGVARVIDGDTLDINGERIRLHGIDAPESGQTCPGGSADTWPCGDAASRQLRSLAYGTVTCEGEERDAYGRLIGTCFAGGRNINAEMVRQGFAWAFIKYAQDYVSQQQEAQAARAGIWAASTPAEPAWDYRKRRWAISTEAAPEGCAIKGNISGAGRIYHMPWSPWYDQVRISPSQGERWFCDEAEAIAAGWRAARVQ